MAETVVLRVTSPCEHGNRHEFLALPEGAEFSTLSCCNSKGVPRTHVVTPDKYPKTKRYRG